MPLLRKTSTIYAEEGQRATKRLKVLENQTSAERTDSNLVPGAAQDSCEPATSPTSASLIDLPNELFDLIITHIPTSDLVNLAQQFNHRLRAMSTRAYLVRIKVLRNHKFIYLTQDVPTIAFHLLSAVRLFDSVSMTCDLFYFVEYGKELRNLATSGTGIRSVCIEFHRQDLSLLQDPRVTASLFAFLSVVKKSCHTLRFERHFRDLSFRQLSVAATCPPRRLRQIPERIVLRVLGTFIVSADFLRVPSLMATCRGLLRSPQVTNFQLDDCETQLECDSILAISKFRALESITIRTVRDTALHIQPDFFMRHTKVKSVSLLAYSIYGLSQTCQTAPGLLLHLPRLTRLSITTNHHLGRLTAPGHLRHCHFQAPSSHIQPESTEFCFNMNSSVAFASSFAQHRFKGLELTIRLPNNILDHVAHFQHSGDVCICKVPKDQLLGVEKLLFEVDSFNEVVSVSFLPLYCTRPKHFIGSRLSLGQELPRCC